MADTSLIFKIIARDQTQAVMARLKRTAEDTGSFVAKALGGPALLPVLAVASTSIASMGVALGAAGAAAGVFGAVAKSAMTEVTEQATKVTQMQDKIDLLAKQSSLATSAEEAAKFTKQAAAAQGQLNAQMAALDPATRGAVTAQLHLKSTWKAFVDQNKPAVFGLIGRGYKLLEGSIGKLQPLFDIGRAAASRLLSALQRVVAGGFIERLTARAGPAMNTLWKIIVNVSTALGNMMGRSGDNGQKMLAWIEKMTARWATWAKSTDSESGFSKFLAYAQQNGPTVVAMLGNLAQAAIHIAQAATPLAPISLAVASALAAIIAAIPPGVITTLVAGFLAFSAAMRVLSVVQVLMTATTWAMNTALLANPITWIVLAIVALIVIIVLLATKTRFFQTVWAGVWGFMKAVGAWFAGPFANFFVSMWNKITASLTRARGQFMTGINAIKGFFVGLGNGIASVWNKVIAKATSVVNWFRAMPGKIRSSLSGMFNGLWTGFRGAINRIIGAWNNLNFTIGGGSFAGVSIPSVSLGTPNLPYLATGGDIQRTGLAVVHQGERISKAAVARRSGPGTGSGGGGGATIRIEGSDARVIRVLLELLRDGIRDQGGDPVRVLTPR